MLTDGGRIPYLPRWEGEPEGNPWMRFRLVYNGELRASQRDPQDNQMDKLAPHKQAIRKVFHRQLKHFWETDWFLSAHLVFPPDYGASRVAADFQARWATSRSKMVPLLDAVANDYQQNGYRFVPLVRNHWRLLCSLDILFLRRDYVRSVVYAGDLDIRLKTLIDGLRKPCNRNELRENETPAEGEDPFFCLLEDDKLITGLTVESDRLLDPPAGAADQDARKVSVIITVDVRPYDVTTFNLSFV